MTKRKATTDLNHENWDKEEKPEVVGLFQKADDDVIEKRVIRKAQRRGTGGGGGGGGGTLSGAKASPFSGFAGFGSSVKTPGNSPFAFLSQTKSTSTQNANKSAGSTDQEDSSAKSDTGKEVDKKSQNLEVLKDLNLSCNKWITEHLEKNPYCILTPIFRDYEKHLAQLELDTELEKKDDTFKLSMPKPNNDPPKPFTFNKESTESVPKEEKEKTFEFNLNKEPSKTQLDGPKNSFPFTGLFPTVADSKINLNVGGGVASTPQKEGDEEEDEESSEPPKSDFVPIVEDDSVYDKRCKVFIKKDSNFIPKGVGTLFLKPVENSKNTQLIVRADTSSGNIILNVLLTSSLPIQKTGKNNVMIICVPTPEAKPPPVPVLIRVKTEDDCNEILKKLEECKAV